MSADARNITQLMEVFDLPPERVDRFRFKMREIHDKWKLIGGIEGLRHIADIIVRAADAFDRMGIWDRYDL